MSIWHTVSIGHDPTGQPEESLSTKIRAQEHGRAADLQERLIRSYPYPHTAGFIDSSQAPYFVIRVPTFSSKFYVTFLTDALTGTMAITLYRAADNISSTVGWAKDVNSAVQEVSYCKSASFTLSPVATTSPLFVMVKFDPDVDINLYSLEFIFEP